MTNANAACNLRVHVFAYSVDGTVKEKKKRGRGVV